MRAESRQRVDASPVQGVGRALEQLLAPALTAFACTDADAAQMAWRVARSVTAAAGFWLAGRLADTLLWDRWLPRRAGVRMPRVLRLLRAALQGLAMAEPAHQHPQVHEGSADRLHAIDHVALFGMLTAGERQRLSSSVWVLRPAEGTVVVKAGGQGSTMFIVAGGVLEVLIPALTPALPLQAAATRVGTLAAG